MENKNPAFKDILDSKVEFFFLFLEKGQASVLLSPAFSVREDGDCVGDSLFLQIPFFCHTIKWRIKVERNVEIMNKEQNRVSDN